MPIVPRVFVAICLSAIVLGAHAQSGSTAGDLTGTRPNAGGDPDEITLMLMASGFETTAVQTDARGYVDLAFTVTTAGTVRDPVVIQSTSSLFERAAIRAVLKFKYKPRVVDGVPVEVPGVKTRISFMLED